MKKKDKYRIYDANICLHCDGLEETSKGNGIRAFLCKKCTGKVKKEHDWYRKYGLYATPKVSMA